MKFVLPRFVIEGPNPGIHFTVCLTSPLFLCPMEVNGIECACLHMGHQYFKILQKIIIETGDWKSNGNQKLVWVTLCGNH